jgi:mycoredoxin
MDYPKKVTMYGAMWCPDTLRAMQFFSNHKIEVEFKSIDDNAENTKFVEDTNNGMRIIPTIILPDESVVVEPSNSELERILNRLNFN